MLNVMKSKMLLMVIIALMGAYIAYQHMSSKALVAGHPNAGVTIPDAKPPAMPEEPQSLTYS